MRFQDLHEPNIVLYFIEWFCLLYVSDDRLEYFVLAIYGSKLTIVFDFNLNPSATFHNRDSLSLEAEETNQYIY